MYVNNAWPRSSMQRAQVSIKKGFYSQFYSQLQNSRLHDSKTLQYTELVTMAHGFHIICIQIIRNNRNSFMHSCMVSAKKACYRSIPYISLSLEEINFLGASTDVASRSGHRPLRTNTYSQISIHANNRVVLTIKPTTCTISRIYF